MAHDSYKTAPECELTCPCRTASRETPDADRIYQMDGAVRASSLTEGVPGSLDMVAQFDAMVAARRAGGVGSATADTTRASTLESETTASVPPVSPRKKRRTKSEMQEFRADKARQIEASYHSLVPAETREWLDAPDPLLQQILESHDDSA